MRPPLISPQPSDPSPPGPQLPVLQAPNPPCPLSGYVSRRNSRRSSVRPQRSRRQRSSLPPSAAISGPPRRPLMRAAAQHASGALVRRTLGWRSWCLGLPVGPRRRQRVARARAGSRRSWRSHLTTRRSCEKRPRARLAGRRRGKPSRERPGATSGSAESRFIACRVARASVPRVDTLRLRDWTLRGAPYVGPKWARV